MKTQFTKQQVDTAALAYRHRLPPEGDRCSTCSCSEANYCRLLDIYMEEPSRSACPLYQRDNQYHPDTVSSPCETLQDLFAEHNITPAVFAAYSGMPIETVVELTEGAIPITLETAAILARMFKMSAQFWLNRQEDYDKWVKQQDGRN